MRFLCLLFTGVFGLPVFSVQRRTKLMYAGESESWHFLAILYVGWNRSFSPGPLDGTSRSGWCEGCLTLTHSCIRLYFTYLVVAGDNKIVMSKKSGAAVNTPAASITTSDAAGGTENTVREEVTGLLPNEGKKSLKELKDTLSPISRPSSSTTANGDGAEPLLSSRPDAAGRASQACDRCRLKKIKCDLKRPQCSSCASVGFECKLSDKLTRNSFPRGYTESLEERIRELESENRRLLAMNDLKEQQLFKIPEDIQSVVDVDAELNSSNQTKNMYATHVCDGICCQDTKLHSRPVATNFNLNDPTSVSFEQNEAPGLMAARAIDQISNHEQSTQLAILVSLSIPRSTEEILFIPQLLAKIRQVFGFTSKQCLYTVSLLSSLKDDLPPPNLLKNSKMILQNSSNFDILTSVNLWHLENLSNFFQNVLKLNILPDDDDHLKKNDDHLALSEIDELVALYFKYWSDSIPIFNEKEFNSNYRVFKADLMKLSKNGPSSLENILNIKIFGCLLTVICQMGILIKYKNFKNKSPKFEKLLSYYHHLMYVLPKNSYFGVITTSIKTVQILSLILFYHLNTGDIIQIYDLRGMIISMAQQLRLHRCPSAVLTGSGSKMDRLEQGNRRTLFWCIYYLDVFCSLQLGVPRLIKDHEIECALPLSSEIHNTDKMDGVQLEGTMSEFSLSVVRCAKVLGNILDSIFKRNMSESITEQVYTIHENALDSWRTKLPKKYQFKLNANGMVDLEHLNHENLILVLLFFLVKSMIYMPLSSAITELANNPKVKNDYYMNHKVSHTSLQQSINALLSVFKNINNQYLPLPLNSSRTMTRFALVSAKGSLEYKKGGLLFEDNKVLLLSVIQEIEKDRKLELPGIIPWHSLKLLDLAVNLFLLGPTINSDKLEKFLQKKINYYNKIMGKPLITSLPSSKTKRKQSKEDLFTANKKRKQQVKTELSTLEVKREPQQVQLLKREGQGNTTESTQSAFVEALQLDPILNANIYNFSGTDLSNFFISNQNGDVPRESREPAVQQPIPDRTSLPATNTSVVTGFDSLPKPENSKPAKDAIGPSLKKGYPSFIGTKSHNNSVSTMMMFLNNDYPFSSMNLNALYAPDGYKESSAQPGKQFTLNTGEPHSTYDFGMIVDASLGLAPLLNEAPEIPGQPEFFNSDEMSPSQLTGKLMPMAVNKPMDQNSNFTYNYKSSVENNEGLTLEAIRGGETSTQRVSNGHIRVNRQRQSDAVDDLFSWQNST
ncbi:DNA-binding transcription factor CAT8 KNAG_0J00250 [Huiozyma naganishii CBS 8797]|uniref:Zn(2)-C6 fungal-type domain-containing protein n=1 Tax=Huiozyma naganishii (strain ATCC MYA-139 / BCRC 22969 / CBS 8797 / KCTC 17520 / NBRC 10181 / NCYC 3082 / Yp74L-3) TaxID=1071383 RepID=J7RQN6_HUIN7|nr:hypothetical protein KNAG_0J00250 [Kazachstania naganishii CBS 8797]CCK72108.1 hypothetical protein KNAG_0J00250 [Kazachstania naganishii CBS 8797]